MSKGKKGGKPVVYQDVFEETSWDDDKTSSSSSSSSSLVTETVEAPVVESKKKNKKRKQRPGQETAVVPPAAKKAVAAVSAEGDLVAQTEAAATPKKQKKKRVRNKKNKNAGEAVVATKPKKNEGEEDDFDDDGDLHGDNGEDEDSDDGDGDLPGYDLGDDSDEGELSKEHQILKAAHFRILNETLYTQKSDKAHKLFREEPDLFFEYHQGFKTQVALWPTNPVDVFIEMLSKRPASLIVGDFGCGEAAISAKAKQKVHSFDLVAVNKNVTACDIAHVPLRNGSLDIAIFCLSLMGTNYLDFIQEANRVLKLHGELHIAEVKSRFSNIEHFHKAMKDMGFDLRSAEEGNKMFVLFKYIKSARNPKRSSVRYELKPCIYKRR